MELSAPERLFSPVFFLLIYRDCRPGFLILPPRNYLSPCQEARAAVMENYRYFCKIPHSSPLPFLLLCVLIQRILSDPFLFQGNARSCEQCYLPVSSFLFYRQNHHHWPVQFQLNLKEGHCLHLILPIDLKIAKALLPEGGLLLSSDQWEGLDGDNVLPLSSTEIERANDGGFVYKRGSWRPVNSTVRKIWHFLGRGMDLKEYAELVHTATGRAEVMNVVFYGNIDSSPLLRPWLLGRVRDNSLAVGLGNLAYNRGRLVGRRPEKRVSLVQKVPSYAEKESVYRMLLQ